MGFSFRQMMRNFADLFTVRKNKRQSGKAATGSVQKSQRKKQQQQQKQQQDQLQQEDQQHQQQHQQQHDQQDDEQQHHHHHQQQQQRQLKQQRQEKQQTQEKEVAPVDEAELLMETPDQTSSFYSDSDDEVFEEEETCSLPAGQTHTTSDDEGNDGDVSGLTSCFSVPGKHSRTLPAIVLQEDCSVSGRHKSDSQYLMTQNHLSITDIPTSQGKASEITFDESTKTNNGGRKLHHFRRPPKTAPFTMKYTKVYGEADGAYRNDSTPRGLVFVCNFSKFKNDDYGERVGSNKDYDNMINLFQQMGYDPFHRRRRYCMTGYITKKVFMEKLGAFARELKHKILCSCVVILMSHGTGPKTFVTSDDQEVDLLDVYKIFDNINCSYLQGKPKIFILQFCRSRELPPCREKTLPDQQQLNNDLVERLVKEQVRQIMRKYLKKCSLNTFVAQGGDKNQLFLQIEENSRQASLASLSSSVMDQEQMEGEAGASTPRGSYQADTNRIPAMPQVGFQRYSDMYSIFSTSPGELSHRHPEKGSLLIQAICHVFAEYAYQDEIDTLVRRVSTYMTKTLQKDDPITVPRQTCERTNNGLDKLFYFNPYEMIQDRQFTI